MLKISFACFVNIAEFPLGPFIFSTGGLLVFFGILVSSFVLIRTVRDEQLSLSFLSNHLFFFVALPLFLGRLGAVVNFFDGGVRPESSVFSWENIKFFFLVGTEGINTGWAIVGFFFAFFVIAFWRKERFFSWLDAFILPSIVLSFFVALGGYISGWNHGAVAPEWGWMPSFFTVSYDLQTVRYSQPLYAVQLYEAFFLGLLFWWGWHVWNRRIWQKWPVGRFFAVMIFALSLLNGALGFFRGDYAVFFFDLRLSQIVSFFVAFMAIIFLIFQRKKSFLERIRGH